jgi:hypothetical protein
LGDEVKRERFTSTRNGLIGVFMGGGMPELWEMRDP